MSGGDAKKEEFINPRDAFYGLNSKYDGEPVKPREVERVKEKSSKFWRDYPELKADFDGVERRREFRHDEWVDDSAIQKEEAYVGDKQIVNEPHATINEEINEKVRRANPRYQKARLHYLGHRFNLIHPDETGLLVAEDNDDFNVGRLRLVEDLLRVTNGEGDLREVKDRLIAVGVYVKDLENLSETIKPMFQKREELLQKFYDEGSKEDLESLEKEIGEIFGVEIIYERIKNGERAQPKKEVEKKVSEETKKVDSTSRVVDTEKNKNEVYENLYLRGYQPKGSDWVKAGEELERLGVDIQKIIKEQNIELKNKLIKAVWIINDKKLSREKIDEAKKLIDDYLGLNENPLLQELDIKAEEPEKAEVIGEEKEKYLEYLGEGLVEDLKNIYPPKKDFDSKKYSVSWRRLERLYGFSRLWVDNEDPKFKGQNVQMRDYPEGQRLVRMLEKYYMTESGRSEGWDETLLARLVDGDEEKLKKLKNDFEEARKRKQEKNDEEKGENSESKMSKKEELAALVREDLDGEDLKKFYRAINVIVENNAIGSEFKTVDEAREFFASNIKVGLKTEGKIETKEDKKDEGKKEFNLTFEIRNKLRDWVDITRKLGRPNLPNSEENLRELVDLGFDVDRADLQRVLESLETIRWGKDKDGAAVRYLTSLFVGGAGGNGEPRKPVESKDNEREDEGTNEEEKWKKVADLLGQLESVGDRERETLYLEIEKCGVRIRGTLKDMKEAGLKDEDLKKVFRNMGNMVKVWEMGEDRAKNEFPLMYESYAKWARLLRLKWYN